MTDKELSWEELKASLKVGTRLQGVVARHAAFGVFVDLPGLQWEGLIQITDFRDEARMTPGEYPAVGDAVETVVLGFKETGQQIWLGMKPSQLAQCIE